MTSENQDVGASEPTVPGTGGTQPDRPETPSAGPQPPTPPRPGAAPAAPESGTAVPPDTAPAGTDRPGGGGHPGGDRPAPGTPAGGTPTAETVTTGMPAGMPAAGPPTAPPPPPTSGGSAPSWSAFPPPPPPARRRRGLLAGVIAATLIAGGFGGATGYFLADNADTASSSGNTSSTSDDGGGSTAVPERTPESVAAIADAALPSVVTIQAEGSRDGGTGTGFVYDEEGHILTNNHVVAAASENGRLTATFSDGETYPAELVGGAHGYDIAVLRLADIGDRDLQPLPMGDSDEVAVGDTTIAIGAPYGLSGTVTTGIVSAKNRPVASSDGMGGRPSYMSALQTDASINPGNSGGPLLNAAGDVVGVNSAIQSNSAAPGQQAGSIGLGFAIPINQAQRVARDLIETGEPVYAVIGVSVDMTENTAAGAQISTEGTPENPAVVPDGPADTAGLRPGDTIVKFGDRVIDSGPTLISEIWTYEPGDTVELTYVRNGEEHTADITLDSRVGDQS